MATTTKKEAAALATLWRNRRTDAWINRAWAPIGSPRKFYTINLDNRPWRNPGRSRVSVDAFDSLVAAGAIKSQHMSNSVFELNPSACLFDGDRIYKKWDCVTCHDDGEVWHGTETGGSVYHPCPDCDNHPPRP